MALARAEVLEAISNMTVLELSGLIKEMEEKFGVSAAAAAVAAAAPAAGGGAAAAAEEQTATTSEISNNMHQITQVVRHTRGTSCVRTNGTGRSRHQVQAQRFAG